MEKKDPAGGDKKWTKSQQIEPHIEHVVREKPASKEDANDWAQLLSNVGWYRAEAGMYGVAEQVDRQALGIREKVLGLEHPSTLPSVSILALLMQFQGKYEEAERMNR